MVKAGSCRRFSLRAKHRIALIVHRLHDRAVLDLGSLRAGHAETLQCQPDQALSPPRKDYIDTGAAMCMLGATGTHREVALAD
jgi:hypothetical protein